MSLSPAPAVVFASIDEVPLAIDAGHRRLPALLERLAADRISLIFCSLRTRAQVERFRQSVGVFHPFVCENGAAAFVPARYFGTDVINARSVAGYQAIEFAIGYEAVVAAVRRAAEQFRIPIRGFADMSIDETARECGLSLLDARLAKLREYGEPFRLLQPHPLAERRLTRVLQSAGICCHRHGAFLHAASVDGPGSAAAVLTRLYRTTLGPVLTAATGGDAMAAVRAGVDVDLDAIAIDNPRTGETLAWMEAIAARVRAARERATGPLRAAAGLGA
jgi:mannosyl-3-phosphoglycerate phosphatase